jgi:hypothetical protein
MEKSEKRSVDGDGNEIPATIYKYCRLGKNLYDLIINGHLWFSSPQDFNDPFDCNMHPRKEYEQDDIITFLKRTKTHDHSRFLNPQEIANGLKLWKKDSKQYEARLLSQIKPLVNSKGLCCFTERKDSVIMWSHYADCHKGVCLGFDLESLPFVQVDRIKYVNEFPDLNWFKDFEGSFVKMLRHKSIEWSYEQEIRIWGKTNGNKPFKRVSLKQIIFGSRIDIKEMFTIRTLLDMCGYQHVVCEKALLNDSQFKIDFAKAIMEYKAPDDLKPGDIDLPEHIKNLMH